MAADPSRMRSGERADELVLDKQAKALWQTPRAEGFDAGRHRGEPDSLHSQTKAWPTPTSSMTTGAGDQRAGGLNLQTAVSRSFRPDPATATDGSASKQPPPVRSPRLNPRFVEWLMGFPAGWSDPSCDIAPTAFAAWEMAWSQLLPPSPFAFSLIDSPRSDAA